MEPETYCLQEMSKEWEINKSKCIFSDVPCSRCLLGRKIKAFQREPKLCKRKKLTCERVKYL